MSDKALLKTDFKNIPPPVRGKVRDVFNLDDNRLLIVTTDRISAYDHVLPSGIPFKGTVLNKISEFWFGQTKDIVRNHLISTKPEDYPPEFRPYEKQLLDRSMMVLKTEPLPIECIVRGYISGSGWTEYKNTGSICGISLPSDLKESSKLQAPLFTPSTKANDGQHDENISYKQAADIIGEDMATQVRDLSIKIYLKASEVAYEKGIIIADTKFEFGIDAGGALMLIDEVLTPDSSRFWPKEDYLPGRSQKSFDKQFVRDYLGSIGWNKKPPVPKLPEEVINKTKEKYISMLNLFK